MSSRSSTAFELRRPPERQDRQYPDRGTPRSQLTDPATPDEADACHLTCRWSGVMRDDDCPTLGLSGSGASSVTGAQISAPLRRRCARRADRATTCRAGKWVLLSKWESTVRTSEEVR